MLPADLIEYENAPAEVRSVFDDIMATRKVDKVNNFWKALAHDPARLTADTGTIVWSLPTGTKYLFPRDGIVIDPGNFSPCAPTKGGKSFTCAKRGHRLGHYKYIVNVNDSSKPLAPLPLPPLDPWVINAPPGI